MQFHKFFTDHSSTSVVISTTLTKGFPALPALGPSSRLTLLILLLMSAPLMLSLSFKIVEVVEWPSHTLRPDQSHEYHTHAFLQFASSVQQLFSSKPSSYCSCSVLRLHCCSVVPVTFTTALLSTRSHSHMSKQGRCSHSFSCREGAYGHVDHITQNSWVEVKFC